MKIVEGQIMIALKYWDNKKVNVKAAHLYRVNSDVRDVISGVNALQKYM